MADGNRYEALNAIHKRSGIITPINKKVYTGGENLAVILIADDHAQIRSILEEYSKKEGYTTLTAGDGHEALRLFTEHEPDVILLDVMMPGIDGFEVCREIRKVSDTPVIMVTARGEDFEKIMGLDIGADDYIVKPFSPAEVMARVRSVLRRISRTDDSSRQVLSHSSLTIDLDHYEVTIDEKAVTLTKKELEILWTLAKDSNKVFSRDNLLSTLWGYDYFRDSRTVDSHIKRLRAKLDRYPHPEWEIKTVWGVGYKFEVTDSAQ